MRGTSCKSISPARVFSVLVFLLFRVFHDVLISTVRSLLFFQVPFNSHAEQKNKQIQRRLVVGREDERITKFNGELRPAEPYNPVQLVKVAGGKCSVPHIYAMDFHVQQ